MHSEHNKTKNIFSIEKKKKIKISLVNIIRTIAELQFLSLGNF